MTESLINPAIDLPKYNALLTRQVIETQREELFTRLVEREAYWINELATHNRTKNPDHHQLASKSSMANAYKSLFPYADRRIQVLSPYDHRNQTITRDTVKECHTVSKLSDIDREQLEVYRSSALFFQFASEMADQGKPITYTQENHNTCVSYRQFYALGSKPDISVEKGFSQASGDLAAIESEMREVRSSTLQGIRHSAWLRSGKQTEYVPKKGWGPRE